MGPALAVIGAVTSVAGTVLSYSAQQKAAKKAEQQQDLNTRKSNRMAIREAQIKRAQAQNAAALAGAGGGSGIAGGTSSLSSQLGSGLGFSTQMSALSSDITKYQSSAQLWGDVAGLGVYAFKAGGGFPSLQSTFNRQPTPAPTYATPHAARLGY
jgi:hypothetical protein